MPRRRTVALLTLMVLTAMAADANPAAAQRRARSASSGGSGAPKPEGIEVSGTYGWMWGGNVDTSVGTIRIGSGNSFFVGLGIPVAPVTRVQLSYTKQDSELNLDSRTGGGTQTLSPMSVNYWQIGGESELPTGSPVRPFGGLSLGVTYYSLTESSTVINGQEIPLGSSTKFSFILGVGAKAYLGQAQRIALRGQFRVFSTFYNTGAGVWFGSGGGGVSFGGSAVWSWEAAGGITIRLGG